MHSDLRGIWAVEQACEKGYAVAMCTSAVKNTVHFATGRSPRLTDSAQRPPFLLHAKGTFHVVRVRRAVISLGFGQDTRGHDSPCNCTWPRCAETSRHHNPGAGPASDKDRLFISWHTARSISDYDDPDSTQFQRVLPRDDLNGLDTLA